MNKFPGATAGGNITLAPVIQGNVMDEEFVNDTVIPALQDVARRIGAELFQKIRY